MRLKNEKITAFSLVELLVAMGIVALVATMNGPAINALAKVGTVNRAIGDVSGTLEAARTFAMANHTYVRVAFADLDSKQLVVATLYSANGTVSAGEDTPSTRDMGNPSLWPFTGKPLTLDNYRIFNTINGTSPATNSDACPFDYSLGPFDRSIAGNSVRFKWVIQFAPSGQAAVLQNLSNNSIPARYIKIALDHPNPTNPDRAVSSSSLSPQNQFIVRLSGINGSVAILRKGEGI